MFASVRNAAFVIGTIGALGIVSMGSAHADTVVQHAIPCPQQTGAPGRTGIAPSQGDIISEDSHTAIDVHAAQGVVFTALAGCTLNHGNS